MKLELCSILLSSAAWLPLATAQAASQQGYIEMKDGVGLRYTVLLPEGQGPFPTVLQYQGYAAGTDPQDNALVFLSPRLLAKGIAILGVSLRGTGCSEGRFELFDPQWIEDGVQVLRWAATQPWSNGELAMAGLSFPGMTQLMVGPTREPVLKALLPMSAMTDLYRDVSYPGGIFNVSFAAAWTAIQKQNGTTALPFEIAEVDRRCAAAARGQNDPQHIVIMDGLARPWANDPFYDRYVPEGSLELINVPTLVTHAWQDEQISPRVSVDYAKLDAEKTWFIFGNGPHLFGLRARQSLDTAEAFVLHFLKHEDNGFPSTPRVQILHDLAPSGEAGWISSYPAWPVATQLTSLYLTPARTLDTALPGQQASFDYRYPQAAPSMISSGNPTYELPIAPGGAVAFTTPALTQDLEILGPVGLDLWLSSTATNTDVQVSLTEVRPDGKEQYVQRGWLRASHRQLDPARSTENMPFHTHTQHDSKPLIPGEATLLNVEIWSVGYVFRAGSAIRIDIEAPVGTTGFRQLDYLRTPAINSVHVGGATPSRLILPVLPGGAAQKDFVACTSIASQPCRTDPGSVPEGTLTVPAAPKAQRSDRVGALNPLLLLALLGAALARHRRPPALRTDSVPTLERR